MKIKAQGLINASKWIEREYGLRDLDRVLSQCSEPVRKRHESVMSIEWHPMGEFVEFLEAVEEVVGDGSGKICELIGQDSARENTRGFIKRAVFYLASPDFLIKRITATWSQFNDQGSMLMHYMDDTRMEIEIKGIPEPHRLFCAVITGWAGVICEALGGDNPRVSHGTCRARGDDACLWRVAWRGTSDEWKSSS